eukprot:CAMPEP_0185771252 /NCGR_PEP_ID=MMETSP1174-20130828/63894_1 /TAXON_ID=35687 /ORGANISM="Dictyocha speculum, Strain CCMP1381" /LENGTH=197 /DNA_ID=CAMNT_0028457055 /DNA_START=33 /DNA_END=626 /DNA_ORIENTATION=+
MIVPRALFLVSISTIVTAIIPYTQKNSHVTTPSFSRRRWLSTSGFAGVILPGVANAEQTISPNAIRTTKGGVKYAVVKDGKCPTADPTGLAGSCDPKTGSLCIIDFTGFLPDGSVFDSTERKGGKPLAFRLGEKQVIIGIEQVVSQMRTGEEVQAKIPSELAYGTKGVCTADGECLIPPNTDLKYFIRLKRVAAAAG